MSELSILDDFPPNETWVETWFGIRETAESVRARQEWWARHEARQLSMNGTVVRQRGP